MANSIIPTTWTLPSRQGACRHRNRVVLVILLLIGWQLQTLSLKNLDAGIETP